jgi:anti-sigma B factor antagonist
MEIASETHGQVLLVRPQGRLDTETAGELELALHDAYESGRRHFVLDMAKISYVSSAGLRVLLALAKKLDGNVGSLRLSALNASVKQVFDIAGFTALFDIRASARLALEKHPHAGETAGGSHSIGKLAAGLLGAPAASAASESQQSTAAAAARLLGVGTPGSGEAAVNKPRSDSKG